MENIKWKLNLFISLALSLIGLSFRVIRIDLTLSNTLQIIISNFFYCFFNIVILNALLYRSGNKFIENKLYVIGCIIGVSLVGFIVHDGILGLFQLETLQVILLQRSEAYINVIFRGILLNSLYFFILYHLHVLNQKQKNSIEIIQLKQIQLEANLSSMKEQLSPHFLFNTLNTLSTLTQEEKVKDYVSELAQVYRYVLLLEKKNIVSLKEELDFIQSYLFIIKSRLENAIDINIQVDKDLLNTLLPPLTLQLLIENAIKHNIASISKPLKIYLYNTSKDYLIIANDLQPKLSTQYSTGIGLNNVAQRYKLLFDRDILIEKSDITFTIKLPVISNESSHNRR